MRKIFQSFFFIFLITALTLSQPKKTWAKTMVSSSAQLIKKINVSPKVTKRNYKTDLRVLKLSQFLNKHNSGLVPYAEYLVKRADFYKLPWHLVAAIAGVESTFCRHIPYNSANCWGWNNGNFRFRSFGYGIETVSKTLANRYFQNGRTTPETIGPVYAPPSSTWAGKVRSFMNKIELQHVPQPVILSLNI